MDQKDLYISKIYVQSEYYLNCHNLSIKSLTDEDFDNSEKILNIFSCLRDYFKSIERADKEQIENLFPIELIKQDMVAGEKQIKEIVKDIIQKCEDYQEYFQKRIATLANRINEEIHKLGFFGEFPKYYQIIDKDLLIVEYDDDIYLENDHARATRVAMVIKVKNYQETTPNLLINQFSYLDLLTKYIDKIESGNIRSFMIHLPSLSYDEEITSKMIDRDLNYLDVLNSILSKQNKLPKWYINVNKSKKDFERTYLMYTMVPVLIIVSIVNFTFFRKSSIGMILGYIIGFGLNIYLCKFLAKKAYEKYHQEEE